MMLDPSFFQMDSTCIRYWHTVVDNLMTHDKTTYKDLMCKFLSHDNTMGLGAKKNVFRVSDKVRLISGCSALKTS